MRRFIGHIPLVRLPDGETEFPLDHGRLRALTFEQWCELDQSFPFSDKAFRSTAPVFLEVDLADIDGPDAEINSVIDAFVDGSGVEHRLLTELYVGLLLATGARLPPPELSVAYLVLDGPDLPPPPRPTGARDTARRIGQGERELILFADEYTGLVVDRSTIGAVVRTRTLLRDHDPGFTSLVSALVRTTRPGFGFVAETLHLVAGLEALLVRRDEPLTASFTRRYAVLCAAALATGQRPEYERLARVLYGLRSDLLHGRDVQLLNNPGASDFLQSRNRWWTCRMATHALDWFSRSAATLDGFHAMLDAAYLDPAAFEAFRLHPAPSEPATSL